MAGQWYLEVLGVDLGATEVEIRRAYRRLASEHHPDKNRSPFAKERMQELNAALEEALKGVGGSSAVRSKRRSAQSNPGKRSSSHSRNRKNGADIKRTVHISLREAYFGCTRDISIGRRSVSVRIPKGAKSDGVIRLASEGERGRHGGQHGDLLVTVQIEDEQLFKRDGDNLIFEVELGHVMEFGGTINVPAFSGVIQMKVPAESKDGQTFRLAGMGMPKHSGGFGDMMVVDKASKTGTAHSHSAQHGDETKQSTKTNEYMIFTENDLAMAIKSSEDSRLTLQSDIRLSSPLPPISSTVLIHGNGKNIHGMRRCRIFEINEDGWLSMEGLHLVHGKSSFGGAISNSGKLTMSDCTFSYNDAAKGSGGAIHNRTDASISASRCQFRSNFSKFYGGAIHDTGGSIMLNDCVFERNKAGSRGGAINHDGDLAIRESQFDHNSAIQDGGALNNSAGAKLTISECELYGNTVNGNGGAIYSSCTSMLVEFCSFKRNSAKRSGGAIYNRGQVLGKTSLIIRDSEFHLNSSKKHGGAIAIEERLRGASLARNRYSGNKPDDCIGCN